MKYCLSALLLALLFATPIFSQNTLNNAGLTAATPAQVAFSLRKLSSSYTGVPIKVRRSSDNAEATIAFDVSNTISAFSLATFSAGVTVGGTFGLTQMGTISSQAAKTGSITVKVSKTGSITVSTLSVTVTGVGTNFTTELVAGDRIFNSANNILLGVVASITSNTSLLLNNYATVNASAISYKTTDALVTGVGTNFTGELSVGDRLFNTSNLYLGIVTSIANATGLKLNAVDAIPSAGIAYRGSSATITGSGTNFLLLSPGDLLISNNVTLGNIASVTNATTLTLTAKAGAAVSALAYRSSVGSIPFGIFYLATSVYINTWYDQSGNGRDAIQLKPANQARIVNAGVLYAKGGRTSLEFSGALASFLQTSTAASYLNNTAYTLNQVTAEATINPNNQFPLTTTGGSGPTNTVSHYGYRSSSALTIAQLSHDHNFNASASTSLESHTGVKLSAAASQLYKDGVSLGVANNGVASYLFNVGLLNIGSFLPTNTFYSGSISEMMIFSSALSVTDVNLLDNNQLLYYNIGTVYWTGAVSTVWSNPLNWSTGIVPTISSPSIALIPAGKPFYPVIDVTTVQANSISVDAGASLTISGTGILQLAGTINNLGTCTASSGTVEYIGTAPQGIANNTFTGSLLNLIINNSTGVTLNGNLTVSGNLTFNSGKLSIYAYALTIGGTVTNTITGGLKGEANSVLVINGTVSPTLSFDQTTPGGTNILKSLTINSAGQTINLSNNLTLVSTGTLTFTAGKLAIGSSTLTLRGLITNSINEGLKGGLASNLIIDGTVSPTLSLDQSIPGTTNALSTLTLNCAGQVVTLNRPIAIASTVTLTAGTLADGGSQVASTGTINISGAVFKLGSPAVATTWPLFTVNNFTAEGTVEYAAGVPQTVSAVPVYQNLTISATGGTIAANNLTVNGVLALSAPNPSSILGSLSMAAYTLNMGASATTVGQGDVTGIVRRTTILPNISYTMGNEFSSITFPNVGTLPSQMSMKIRIGSTPSWQAGAVKRVYDFIQTGGTGTKAVITAHYLDGDLNGNVENKLVDFSYRFAGTILTEHGKSNFNTTQNWITLSNVDVFFFASTFGNIELSFDESSLTTLTWNGLTSTSWITATNWTPNGGPSTNTILIVPDAATTPNDPVLPATASNGSLTIEAGGIVNSDPAAQLTLNNSGLAWSNAGILNANTSTVLFSNASATMNGVTNFNNVTINSGAGLLLTTGTIMRIGGTITNNGSWATGLLSNTVEYNGNNQTILVPNGPTQSYNNLIISGTGTSILPAASLNIFGNLTINGTISTTGNTTSMGGPGLQAISGSSPVALNNLIINNASSPIVMNKDLTVAGALTITTGKLAIGANTLTLSGNLVNTALNGLTGSTNSNLVVNGAVSPTLSFDQSFPGTSNALRNLTINSSGQVPLLGSDLEVENMLTFTAGKLAINNNTLTLKGGITNTVPGGLRGGSGSNLKIRGGAISPVLSFDQTIAGTTNLLNSFSMNSTGQQATLANSLVLGGLLDLSDGLINTTTGNSLTLTAAAGFTGGSDLSFVNGPLTRNTNSTAGYVYPVGKTNTYRPVSVTPVTTADGTYKAAYFPTPPPAGAHDLSLTAIATNEYWDIGNTGGPDIQITLIYTGHNTWSAGSPTSRDEIFVADLNAGTWEPAYGGTLPGNTGSGITPVTSKVMNSSTSYTFGYGPAVILPVTLLEFRASLADDVADLFWKTANEFSLATFDVQRSPTGREFYAIGSVAATNNPFVKTYTWKDALPLNGTSYYRLKMIDIDGAYKYSGVVKIDRNAKKSLSVYPNPVTGHSIMLQMYGQLKGDYVIALYNTHGEKIMTSRFTHDGNASARSIALEDHLPGGVYYLGINMPGNSTTTIKIFIR